MPKRSRKGVERLWVMLKIIPTRRRIPHFDNSIKKWLCERCLHGLLDKNFWILIFLSIKVNLALTIQA